MSFLPYLSLSPFINFMQHTEQVLTPLDRRERQASSKLTFLSLSLDQGKHGAHSLYRFLVYNSYHYVLACALKYRSLMKP
jgi:hypothetical protein